DEHEAALLEAGFGLDGDGAAELVVACARDLLREECRGVGLDARDEEAVVLLEDGARDLEDLERGLARPVDDFGMAAAQLAVRVEPRVAEVEERQRLEEVHALVDTEA